MSRKTDVDVSTGKTRNLFLLIIYLLYSWVLQKLLNENMGRILEKKTWHIVCKCEFECSTNVI